MQGCTITFAHRSFVWESEASQKAHVHCVVIGLAGTDTKPKRIFDGDRIVNASHINGYLLDGSDTLVTSRNKPLCDVPRMVNGNKPADGGHLIIEDADLEEFLRRDPQSREFIHPLVGAQEFINGKRRWCLWLVDAPTAKLARCPLVMERIRLCKESRQASIAAAIRKFADTPSLFVQCTQPVDEDFIIVPSVSSEKREYVPMGFVKAGTIATNLVYIIPHATLYHFGVLMSGVHMAWMRTVCGRLETRYRYSKDVVYNNFPWPSGVRLVQRIEQTAQAILDARAAQPSATLAQLYDPVLMPPALRHAHRDNDRAVLAAYGWPADMEERDVVGRLFQLYRQKVGLSAE